MQFLQKIPPWCDKMPKINLRDRGFIGLRKWNLGVVTSREERNAGNIIFSKSTYTTISGETKQVAAVDFTTNPIGYEFNDVNLVKTAYLG